MGILYLNLFRKERKQKKDEDIVGRVYGRSNGSAVTQEEARILGWWGLGCTHVQGVYHPSLPIFYNHSIMATNIDPCVYIYRRWLL